jgi:hypothetical protein
LESSILNSIKKLLGIDPDDISFDNDILIHINSTIPNLSQMGIGPKNGFIVTSADDKWIDYIDSSTINLEGVKTYLYLKIKLIFDPPTNSTTIDAINKSIDELGWRMMLAVETNNLEV